MEVYGFAFDAVFVDLSWHLWEAMLDGIER